MIIKPEITSPIKSKIPGKQANYISPSTSNYCSEARDYFRQTDFISPSYKYVIDQYFKGLIVDGIFEELEWLYIMGAPDPTLSKINTRYPRQYTLTPIGGMTYTGTSWQGDGSTGYMKTGWNASTNATKYKQDDCSFGVYSLTDVTLTANDIGVFNGGSNVSVLNLKNVSSAFVWVVNSSSLSLPSVVTASSIGLFSAVRNNSATAEGYKNGVLQGSFSIASQSPANLEWFLFARNNGAGTPAVFSPRKQGMAYAGSSKIDPAKLTYRTDNLFKALGII